jgi:hypothetical protein
LADNARPYPQRQIVTRFLRVPAADWLAVKYGEKTEFRTRSVVMGTAGMWFPSPIVAWASWRRGSQTSSYEREQQVMVFEEHRQERLFLVGEDRESLRREGFNTYEEFRRYWQTRYGTLRADDLVHVWRVRCWTDDDDETMGRVLLDRLYGEYLRGDLEPVEF